MTREQMEALAKNPEASSAELASLLKENPADQRLRVLLAGNPGAPRSVLEESFFVRMNLPNVPFPLMKFSQNVMDVLEEMLGNPAMDLTRIEDPSFPFQVTVSLPTLPGGPAMEQRTLLGHLLDHFPVSTTLVGPKSKLSTEAHSRMGGLIKVASIHRKLDVRLRTAKQTNQGAISQRDVILQAKEEFLAFFKRHGGDGYEAKLKALSTTALFAQRWKEALEAHPAQPVHYRLFLPRTQSLLVSLAPAGVIDGDG